MTYTLGDGDRLKIRLSQLREDILFRADELLKLAAEAVAEGDNAMASAVLDCSREIKESIKKLRGGMR